MPTKYASAALGSGSETCFDITDLVKAWKSGSRSAEAGFLLKNSSEALKRVYCSSEYSTASKKPRVVLTYVEEGSGGGSALDGAAVLSLNSPVSVSVVVANEMRYFKFTPSSTGFYSFESLNISSGDPYGWMYNNVNVLLSSDNNAGGNKNFRITYHLVSGATYFFAAGCFGTGTGGYTVRIKNETSASTVETSVFAWGTDKNITCTNKREVTVCTFTPDTSGEYLFSSVSMSGTPKIWLYDSSLTSLGTNDCGSGHNFRLVKTLTSGSTYYVVFGQFVGRVGNYTVRIMKPTVFKAKTYCFKNSSTLKYIDIVGPTAQEFVHQWTYHTNLQCSWRVEKQSDGYYTIRSEYGDKKYVGISSTATGEDNIKLYSSISDSTKWKIFADKNNVLIVEPKTSTGHFICAPDSDTGTKLQLETFSCSDILQIRWSFEPRSSTPLEGQRLSNWCWATSVRMLTNHYFDVPDDRTQDQAVSAVLGYIVNTAGSLTDTICAASYYRSGNINTNQLNLVSGSGKIFSENTLRRFLDDGHVVFIARGKYDENNVRKSGHATLIIGYTTVIVNGTLQYRYIIYDPYPNPKPSPWSSSQATTGQVLTQSYAWICNGQNALNGEKTNEYIWDQYIVVETAYSDNTISMVYN